MYRILVVDDEPMIRKGLEKLIQQADSSIMHTDTAENGVEALEKIIKNRPDFLFTDIRMPKMDGLDLCRRVSEQFKEIDMVVISGYGDFEYARQSMMYGVKEYILKPVTKKGVFETVGKLIASARKKEQRLLIPIAKLDQWIKRLEDAVWHLKETALQEIASDIEAQGLAQLELVQLKELLNDLLKQLIDRLNERDVYTFAVEELPAGALSEKQCYESFLEILLNITNQIKSKRKGNMKEPVEEAKAYIERNLSKELSLNEVAEMLGLNPSYFSQLFKQMTDETFVHYRIKKRMEKAKKLLAIPHYKITDISFEVGYADHPHFTKTFKRFTGYTPSEYREKLGIE